LFSSLNIGKNYFGFQKNTAFFIFPASNMKSLIFY